MRQTLNIRRSLDLASLKESARKLLLISNSIGINEHEGEVHIGSVHDVGHAECCSSKHLSPYIEEVNKTAAGGGIFVEDRSLLRRLTSPDKPFRSTWDFNEQEKRASKSELPYHRTMCNRLIRSEYVDLIEASAGSPLESLVADTRISMRFSITFAALLSSAALTVASPIVEKRAMTAQQMVTNINKITQLSENLQHVVSKIQTGSNIIFRRQSNPFETVIEGFSNIIQVANDDISQMDGTKPFKDSDAQQFVVVHQALLKIVIGKSGLLESIFLGPVAAVLRSLEGVVDTLAFGIIDAVPVCEAKATKDKESLDNTLAFKTWNPFQSISLIPRCDLPIDIRFRVSDHMFMVVSCDSLEDGFGSVSFMLLVTLQAMKFILSRVSVTAYDAEPLIHCCLSYREYL
nr:hypothetical protein CFP56_03837 [Quercus suber]